MKKILLLVMLVIGCDDGFKPKSDSIANNLEFSISMQTDEGGYTLGLSGNGIASECYTQNFYRITDEVIIDPINYSISYPYPNPSNGTFTMTYTLPQDKHTKIFIVNQQNIILETILDANQVTGYHSITINLSNITDHENNILQAGYYRVIVDFGSYECFANLNYSP